MALQTPNFVDAAVKDQLMTDFRRTNELLNVLLDGQASRDVLQQALNEGASGGFAKQLVLPMKEQDALSPTDGYSAILTFPSSNSDPDLSSGYDVITDTSILYDINRQAIGTHRLPDIEKWTHAAGSLLGNAKVQADLQEMRDVIEEAVIADMDRLSGFQTAAAGVGAKFPLVTTSQTSLLDDIFDLTGEFNRQNIPRGDRWLALPAAREGLAVKYDGLASNDFTGIGDRQEAIFDRIGGFNIIYTNSLSSSRGMAFTSAAYAVVMPMGIQVESLRDKDRIGDFTRVYTVFGIGSNRELVSTAANGDAVTVPTSRPGIISLDIT